MTFEELLERYPNGLPGGFAVEMKFYDGISLGAPGSNDDIPVPPPPAPVAYKYEVREISEHDPNPNGAIKIYKSPDTNDTNSTVLQNYSGGVNVLRVFKRWQDVPRLTGWDPTNTAANENVWREWRCVHQKPAIVYNINGRAVTFPAFILQSTGQPPEYCWVRLADLGRVVREE